MASVNCVVCAFDVAGSFEIAMLRFCRMFNTDTNSVLLGSQYVALDLLQAVSEYNAVLRFSSTSSEYNAVMLASSTSSQ